MTPLMPEAAAVTIIRGAAAVARVGSAAWKAAKDAQLAQGLARLEQGTVGRLQAFAADTRGTLKIGSGASEGATLRPYGGPGGGHHVPAKSAFTGAAGYDANAALAIPNAELARLKISHSAVPGAQMTGYRAFAKTGAPLTWDAVSTIETNALIRGGAASDVAAATVTKAVDALKASGVAGPTRIPWGS